MHTYLDFIISHVDGMDYVMDDENSIYRLDPSIDHMTYLGIISSGEFPAHLGISHRLVIANQDYHVQIPGPSGIILKRLVSNEHAAKLVVAVHIKIGHSIEKTIDAMNKRFFGMNAAFIRNILIRDCEECRDKLLRVAATRASRTAAAPDAPAIVGVGVGFAVANVITPPAAAVSLVVPAVSRSSSSRRSRSSRRGSNRSGFSIVSSADVAAADAPVSADAPASADVAAADAPAPVSADAPAPVSADAPAPVSADAPAPVSADAPAPVSADAVDAAPTLASAPTPAPASNYKVNGTWRCFFMEIKELARFDKPWKLMVIVKSSKFLSLTCAGYGKTDPSELVQAFQTYVIPIWNEMPEVLEVSPEVENYSSFNGWLVGQGIIVRRRNGNQEDANLSGRIKAKLLAYCQMPVFSQFSRSALLSLTSNSLTVNEI